MTGDDGPPAERASSRQRSCAPARSRRASSSRPRCAAIERLNPELNAFVALCPERALAEADRVRAGDPRPLCGVPIGIKDLLSATEGLPTSEGSRAFGDWVADHDSAHVRRLREAGAIIVGKTNTPELGLRPVTENARFGATRNPWSPELSPGGSSGGSAAAVASGMVALADGSDLGGSIRIPASCCGLVGLKPSRGRVSIGPDFGDIAAGMPVDGVLARTVRDTAVALDAIAGYEPGDRHGCAVPPRRSPRPPATRPGDSPSASRSTAPLGVPVDDEPRPPQRSRPRRSPSLGHDVRERRARLGRRGVPAELGDVRRRARCAAHACACSSACTAAASTRTRSSRRPAPG